jgi:hypothetical protein
MQLLVPGNQNREKLIDRGNWQSVGNFLKTSKPTIFREKSFSSIFLNVAQRISEVGL